VENIVAPAGTMAAAFLGFVVSCLCLFI